MPIESLIAFFKWCTVINGTLLFLWSLVFLLFPGMVYTLHSKWFPISEHQHRLIMYAFLGAFKLLFLVFNLTPYIVLIIIS